MNSSAQEPRPPARPARPLLVVVVCLVAVAAVMLLVVRARPSGARTAPLPGPNELAQARTSALTDAQQSHTEPQNLPGQVDPVPFREQWAALTNASLPLKQRRKVAETLAQDGSEAALATLKAAFAAGPEDLRAAIAESLGQCANPECARWLESLLQDPSTLVARGAVRALSTQDTPETAGALVRLLGDASADPDLRLEVAASLGSLTQPGVVQALADAARNAEDPELAQAALNALGQRDFAETVAFFTEYLQTPGIATEQRVAAIEALAQASGDPSALLLKLAADPDAEVRAAAAWALSATEASAGTGAQLLGLLGKETDPDVRLSLYQALRNQEGVDSAAALALVEQETNPSARVAGLDLLAKLLREDPSGPLQSFFNSTGIAELKQIILTSQNYDDRQAAVLALNRVHTPEALAILNDLASHLNPQPDHPQSQTAQQR